MSNEDQEQDLPSLIAQRQSKLAVLKEEGVNPYPNDFRRDNVTAELLSLIHISEPTRRS